MARLVLIGKNQVAGGTLGLHMHSTLVVHVDGIPLGVPQTQYEEGEGNVEKEGQARQRVQEATVGAGTAECTVSPQSWSAGVRSR